MFLCSAGHAVADMFHLLSDSHPMAAREKTLRFGHTQMSLSRPSDDKSWAGFLFIFGIWKIVTLVVFSLILLNYCLSVCYNRLKNSLQTARLDLYVNGEILCPSDDKRLISQVPLRDRTVSVRLAFHLWMNLHLTVVLLLLFWFFLIDPYLTSLETNCFSCGKGHRLNLMPKLLRGIIFRSKNF